MTDHNLIKQNLSDNSSHIEIEIPIDGDSSHPMVQTTTDSEAYGNVVLGDQIEPNNTNISCMRTPEFILESSLVLAFIDLLLMPRFVILPVFSN